MNLSYTTQAIIARALTVVITWTSILKWDIKNWYKNVTLFIPIHFRLLRDIYEKVIKSNLEKLYEEY